MTKLLIKRAKKGDKKALVELIMHYKEDFYKLSYIYMKNEKDAIDVLDDMILIVYEKIGKLKNDDSFKSWCQTILVNCCKRALKQNKRVVYIHSPIEIASKEEMENNIVNNQSLQNAIETLSPKHQEILKLKYFLDMDTKTIAILIKKPEGTVKSRLSYAMKALKAKLGGEYND